MNKKFFLALILILGIAGATIWFFFGRTGSAPADQPVVSDQPCLVFQSENPQAACFMAPRPAPSPSVASPVETACPQASLFERNDCITKLAEKTEDTSVCSLVEGSLARAACFRGSLSSPVTTSASPTQNAYESFVRSYQTQASASSAVEPGPVSSSEGLSSFVRELSQEEKDKTSIEGFYKRSANETPLTLYAIQPYQNRPGSIAKVQGWGFALDATNTLYVGSTAVSGLASADGMTLEFTVPSVSSGTYEVYVSNARGSSRVAERPIYMVVTTNPVAAPRITSVSPANPVATDTITLSGENLMGLKGVYTTLGPSKNASLSFKISDLEYSKLVLEDPSVKGMKIPLYVYVLAEGGLNSEPFIFDVQY